MTRWAPASVLSIVFALSADAAAQPGDGVPPPLERLEVGASALPGGAHIGYAESLPAGTVATAFVAGFGYRSALLASDHTMTRGVASAALAYSATDFLSFGVILDGRYDKHSGSGFEDDGWVGEPRLHVRLGKELSGGRAFGGQLTVWVPGKDAPSIVPSATSVDARALFSMTGTIRFGINAGFRFDNSASSVEMPMLFSAADQASLGVSEWSAVVGGARIAYPKGKLVVALESQIDVFVGSGAPNPSVFVGGSLTYDLTPNLAAELFVHGNYTQKPTGAEVMSGMIPLIRYEPLFAGGLGLQARFGGPSATSGGGGGGGGQLVTCWDGSKAESTDKCPAEPPPTATLKGKVTDDGGAPIVNAKVTITTSDGKTVIVQTDNNGDFNAEGMPPGEATLDVEADQRVPGKQKLLLRVGPNDAPTTALAPQRPPAKLRAIIRSFGSGAPIAGATITVKPGGHVGTTAADGTAEIIVPPGTYEVTISAPGFAPQNRQYTVEEKGVAIVNIDLRKP
jgi:hypothetical protein